MLSNKLSFEKNESHSNYKQNNQVLSKNLDRSSIIQFRIVMKKQFSKPRMHFFVSYRSSFFLKMSDCYLCWFLLLWNFYLMKNIIMSIMLIYSQLKFDNSNDKSYDEEICYVQFETYDLSFPLMDVVEVFKKSPGIFKRQSQSNKAYF